MYSSVGVFKQPFCF